MPDVGTARKATPTAEQRAAIRRVLQTDLYALCEQVLYAGLGARNQLSRTFHRPLCEWTQTTPYRENLYLMFRGSFKTSILTVGKNLQAVLRDPGSRGLIASNKSENAEEMLGEIKQHMKHPYLLWAFPEIFGRDPTKLPEWTTAGVTVLRPPTAAQRGSTLAAIGVEGELVSQHYDRGTFDDVVGKQNSQTRAGREDVIDFLKKARPLIDPIPGEAGRPIDYIGTTWHYDDAWAWIKRQRAAHGMQVGVYERACWSPCVAGDPLGADVAGHGWVRPTFPERFTMAALLAERAVMGSSDFAAQYLMNPVAGDTAHFTRARLDVTATHPPFHDLWVALTVDPAISTKKWSDWAALAVGGFDRKNDLWLLALERHKRDEHGLVRAIFDLHRRFPMVKAIGIEATGFQRVYMSLLTMEGERRGYQLPIHKLEKDTQTTKEVRIAGLQGAWEGGQIHVLASCQALGEFLDEADKFRPDRESAHDDLLDAVVDLYQVRGRPAVPGAPTSDLDPGLAERWAFEQALRARKPWLDAASARAAWQQAQYGAAAEAEREAVVLGSGRDEFWA